MGALRRSLAILVALLCIAAWAAIDRSSGVEDTAAAQHDFGVVPGRSAQATPGDVVDSEDGPDACTSRVVDFPALAASTAARTPFTPDSLLVRRVEPGSPRGPPSIA